MNIVDSVRMHAQRNPRGIALLDGDLRVDWAHLNTRIVASAGRLFEAGVRQGDLAALSFRDNIAQTVLTFALARLGSTSCALDWRARPAERYAILSSVHARWLVTDHAAVSSTGIAAIAVDGEWAEPRGSSPAPVVPVAESTPLMLLLSSGTTGQPKAMVLSHEAAAWRAIVRLQTFGFRPASRVLNTMPLHASATVAGLFGQIIAGATTIFAPSLFAPEQIVELLHREKIEHVGLVPTILRQLLSLPRRSRHLLDGLASLVTLGAVLHPEEKRDVMANLSPNLHEYYGSAISGPIACGSPADNVRLPGSVGRAPMFVQVDIVDEAGKVLPSDQPGRVRVRSPGAAGKFSAQGVEDSHGDSFGDDGLYPGDLGRLDRDGYLFLEGRVASVIIRGGQNIQAEEVERILMAHAAVVEAAVIGRPDALLGEVPVAFIVAQGSVQSLDLELHCRQRLTSYKLPVEFRIVPALPRNSAGKIHRAELAKLLS